MSNDYTSALRPPDAAIHAKRDTVSAIVRNESRRGAMAREMAELHEVELEALVGRARAGDHGALGGPG
jgi:hypothetical protein